ncbi:hypothetical protein QNH23_17750 [Siminovitchia fortis]|uniref:Uncharacterized protein n=1 Tax=Siminovitchia fortis TaxID=254758 RepID=A0A443IZ39_9BACI|nr:hypothetical protein [Siminovitchia fortis]RWR13451.1 hypothetical protein D4N35_004430 [Siminovitchia fortis]WHY81688.1 hypothetical protein QNH23_17750 [Siminovitchia fortis]
MKFGLKIIGFFIAAEISYLLYQSRLGAIPFLVTSVVLFYLGYRLILGSGKNRAEGRPPE